MERWRVKVGAADLTIRASRGFSCLAMQRIVPGGDGKPLPGLAPVAIQQGRYVAERDQHRQGPSERRRFIYVDRGMRDHWDGPRP